MVRLRVPYAALVVLSLFAAAAFPAVSAYHAATYDLVGEDPADDFGYTIGGQDEPSGVFGEGKVDIIGLEMGTDADALTVRLSLAAPYQGTGGHMFTVWFDYAGSSYFTCWNIQTAGTTTMSQDVAENVFGCSLFNSVDATPAGPATRDGGVVADVEEEHAYVEWPVPRSDIGDPADGDALTNVYAETYARTGNPGAAGSTTHQDYQWHKQDVAPDEGGWEYVLGGAAGSLLSVEADRANATAGPGSWLVFEVLAYHEGNVTANASFEVSGPDGWESDVVTGAPAAGNQTGNETGNQTGNQTGNETTLASGVEVHVGIPESAENGTYNVTVSASSDGNMTDTLNLTVVVDTSLEAVDERPTALDGPTDDVETGNETANATAEATDDALIPGPAPLLVAAAVAAAAVVVRRRRETL